VRNRPLGVLWLFFAILSVAFIGAVGLACSSAGLKGAPPPGGSSGDPPVDEDGNPVVVVDGGRDPGKDLDGGVLPVTSAVTIQVIPSDNGAALLAAIKGTTKSLHMTMYLLSDNEVINALGALKAAGKDVKVILNQEFPQSTASNAATYTKLQQLGVSVAWGPGGFNFTHAKTILIDGTKLIVMTMNLTFSSPTTNREFIATDTDPDDIAEAEAIFQADFANKASLATGKLLVSPRSSVVLDARTRLVALIDTAKSTLDVAAETLSDDFIVDAIIAAKLAGVQVRIVIDAQTGSNAQQEAVAKLKQNGVPISSLGNPDMHAKAIVVDGRLAYVGSQNFTANSLNDNREIGIITDATTEVAKVQSTIAKDFAAASPL
jgi:cardiolipin synthase A/B